MISGVPQLRVLEVLGFVCFQPVEAIVWLSSLQWRVRTSSFLP